VLNDDVELVSRDTHASSNVGPGKRTQRTNRTREKIAVRRLVTDQTKIHRTIVLRRYRRVLEKEYTPQATKGEGNGGVVGGGGYAKNLKSQQRGGKGKRDKTPVSNKKSCGEEGKR